MVANSSAGGDAARAVADEVQRTNMFCDRVVLQDHREKGELRTPVFVSKPIPNREAKNIPRAQLALDSEWKQLWDMKCWIAESVS